MFASKSPRPSRLRATGFGPQVVCIKLRHSNGNRRHLVDEPTRFIEESLFWQAPAAESARQGSPVSTVCSQVSRYVCHKGVNQNGLPPSASARCSECASVLSSAVSLRLWRDVLLYVHWINHKLRLGCFDTHLGNRHGVPLVFQGGSFGLWRRPVLLARLLDHAGRGWICAVPRGFARGGPLAYAGSPYSEHRWLDVVVLLNDFRICLCMSVGDCFLSQQLSVALARLHERGHDSHDVLCRFPLCSLLDTRYPSCLLVHHR